MTSETVFFRRCRRLVLAIGLAFAAATAAPAQDAPAPESGVSYPEPTVDEAVPEATPEQAGADRPHTEIHPYLEVAQVVSAELDGGDTLTYTSVAAGVDGTIQTRRVSVALSYRYQRNIEWEGEVGDTDIHSGVAQIGIQVIPGTLSFDAGALATRTGGEGRAFGVTDRDASVEVYSAYAGPTLSTHAGPVALNAAYRLGYVAIDDDTVAAGPQEDFDSATAHMMTASAGMAPGQLPFGWTVGAGYTRTDTESEFDHRFEGAYVRGDVVVPVGPTLALTAGVGYEDIEASQLDLVRDANGVPVIGPDGGPVANQTGPRLLTYDLDGIIYDAGLIWRPTARTELQVRAGYRYGGTTFLGTLSHQFSARTGMTIAVYDTLIPFANVLVNDLSGLPDNFEVDRDPLTGNLGGCVFGTDPGTGACLGQTLQSIRGNAARARGASLVVTGDRGLLSWGVGVGYTHHRYGRPQDPAFDVFGGNEDETFGLFGSLSRQLSRTSHLDFSTYATWFDTDQANFDTVFSTGGTLSYNRSFLLDRLQLIAALGLNHNDNGVVDSTIISALLGLRYTF